MLGLKDKKVMKSLKQDGFIQGFDKDYDWIRVQMKLAEEFNGK